MTSWVKAEVDAAFRKLQAQNAVMLNILQRIEYGMRRGGGPDRAEINEAIRKVKSGDGFAPEVNE